MTVRRPWKATFGYSGDPPAARLPLLLTGPNGKPCRVVGVIDTGSSSTGLPYAYAAELGFSLSDLQLGLCTDAAKRHIACLVAQSLVRATIPDDPSPMCFELWPSFIDGAHEALWALDFAGTVAVTFDAPGDRVTLACNLVYDEEMAA